MLVKHTLIYALTRGIPGIAAFATIILYSHLLEPTEYGRSSIVLATVGLANLVMFQWIYLVTARFLNSSKDEGVFLGEMKAMFLLCSCVAFALALAIYLLNINGKFSIYIPMAVSLLLVQGTVELTLIIANAKFNPYRYGAILGLRATSIFLFGYVFATGGLGAKAPVLAAIAGQLITVITLTGYYWRGVRAKFPSSQDAKRYIRYGLPLIVNAGLAWIISTSDRLMLAWLLEEDDVGQYSVSYDLPFQALTLLLVVINTAAYPLAIRAYNRNSDASFVAQLQQNGELIITAALVGAIAFVTLSQFFIQTAIGVEYRQVATQLFPLIAIAAALAGIKAYYFDIAFHLSQRSSMLAWITATAALFNLLSNLLLIPIFGVVGAAIATVLAYSVSMMTSAFYGAKILSMPPLTIMFKKTGLVAICASLGFAIPRILIPEGITGVLLTAAIGTLSAVACMWWLNIANLRQVIYRHGFN